MSDLQNAPGARIGAAGGQDHTRTLGTGRSDDSASRPRERSDQLDAFRGIAIALMMLDHGVYIAAGPDEIRWTLGRLAMPMFFLLAGHLSTRLRWRHLQIGLLGACLPLAVPWIDNPNVLLLWALGCVGLWCSRRFGFPVWVLVAVPLVQVANGISIDGPGYYSPGVLLALMALGTMIPEHTFTVSRRLPGRVEQLLAAVGRHPILWYVGHLLIFQSIGTVL